MRVADAFCFVNEILIVDENLFYGVGIAVTLDANIASHSVVPVVKLPLFGASPTNADFATAGLGDESDAGF
jgi:hypothetical protein